ncbi:hypothetical protein K227x_37570 [Rubripirellula lacrimiformis]|uniref:Uncharacterized protein n=1 Tax=Rubripirellula lacrimiformis TaxID=1930273 RepID=A0A517NE01_9BACT|nr:hypothetical protein [Rubripirellula lacrimiformis]QDT05357.1 hypothetical protein K227x_37570 [Rubripirellula lacrimiformis]
MYRWLWMGSLAALLVGSTGCLHHNVRGGNCSTGACSTGACGSAQSCGGGQCGGCNECADSAPVGVLSRLKHRSKANACNGDCGCGKSGVLGRLGTMAGVGNCGCGSRTGCQTGPLGWQQGGLDYSSHLNPGLLGHNAGNAINGQQFAPGPPTGQVAYPYYSVRGPRDFFVDNPPTIGR